MTEIDEVEYQSLRIKIRRLEEKINDWEKQDSVIRHILDLLQKSWADAVRREKDLQIKYGIYVENNTKAAP